MTNLEDLSKIDIEINKQSIINSSDDINSLITKSNYKNRITNVFFICTIVLFSFCLVIGSILYLVFAIMSLCYTSYAEQKNMCEQSNMWIYILINLIINSINTTSLMRNKSSDETQNSIPKLNILILLGILSLDFNYLHKT